MEVPDGFLDNVGAFIQGFGNGPTGVLVLLMVLATLVAIFCIPHISEDFFDYKKSKNENETKNKELELALLERIERLASKGIIKTNISSKEIVNSKRLKS